MEVVEGAFVRVPFEALKRAAKERKTVVEEVENIVHEINKGGQHAHTQGNQQGEGTQTQSQNTMDVDTPQDNVGTSLEEKATSMIVDETFQSEECACVDKAIERIQKLKRGLEDSSKTEMKHLTRCKARLEHLMSLGEFGKDRVLSWNKKRMSRLIVDYLLRQGYHKSALEAVKIENGLEHYVDLDIFQSAQKIIESLAQHRCEEALQWCANNHSKLKRIKSKFEFKVRLREFIDLVRENRLIDAVKYARKYLSKWAVPNTMAELQEAMSTLVYGTFLNVSNKDKDDKMMDIDSKAADSTTWFMGYENCKKIYGHLFDDSQWDDLINIFKCDMYQLYMLPSDSNLEIHLQAGIAALKTPMSYTHSCSKEDPLSLQAFRKLSEGLPYAKHSKSRLVCYITKQVMNEDNPPMVLPNGMVYSKEACEALAAKHGMKVVCPRTGAVYDISDLRRAYPV